jgi:hypothetical protein
MTLPRPRNGQRKMLATTRWLAVGALATLLFAAVTASPASAHRRVAFFRTDKHHATILVSRLGTALSDSQSSNWSGYNQGILDTDTPVSSISGQWVVPTATAHTAGQAEDSATWVGIGGGCLESSCTLTDETLIQAGTEQSVAANGTASYDAWWEIIPVPEIESTIAVHPGDVIDCSISSTVPGVWTITLNDTTDGQSFTETVPYPSDESTAEWIEETPTEIGTSGAATASLPNLTTVQFSEAAVNGANANLAADQAVQLTDSSGAPLATPSAPVGGNAFDDCAYASTCPAP